MDGKGARFRPDLRFTHGDRPGIVIVHDPVTDKRIELNEVDCLAVRAMEGIADLDACTEKAREVIPTATRAEVERLVRELSAYGVLEEGVAGSNDVANLPDANAWHPIVRTIDPPRRRGRLVGGGLAFVAVIAVAQFVEVERTIDAPATREPGAPVVVLVEERDVPAVAVGATVKLRPLIAPERPANGKIVERGRRVEVVEGAHVVRFTTDITDPALLEGMTGTASIAAGPERLLERMTRWGQRVLFG